MKATRLLLASTLLTAAVAARAQLPLEPPVGVPGGRCSVPESLRTPASLPGLARSLARRGGPVTVVVMSPLGTADLRPGGDVVRWTARLRESLQRAWPDATLRFETVGESRATVARMASMIPERVLPLQPDLVLWSIGRADLRQGVPSARFGRALERGLRTLAGAGVDTVVLDLQYHPQSEALFRSIDHRQQLRWAVDEVDAWRLRRYEMIEHWAQRGVIDLDATDAATQRAAVETIERCTAVQVSAMLRAAVAPR